MYDDYDWGYDDFREYETPPINWRGLWIGLAIIATFIAVMCIWEFLC